MMTEPILFRSTDEWRKWLKDNHGSSSELWVKIRKKNSSAEGLTYDELLDQALCFGWIDGVLKSIDADYFKQRFTPRRRGSIWSKRNKDKITRLLELGLVTEAGLRAVEDAKRSGKWDAAYSSNDVTIPKDVALSLEGNPATRDAFYSSSNSMQLMWIHWVNEAVKEETRQRRILKLLEQFRKTT